MGAASGKRWSSNPRMGSEYRFLFFSSKAYLLGCRYEVDRSFHLTRSEAWPEKHGKSVGGKGVTVIWTVGYTLGRQTLKMGVEGCRTRGFLSLLLHNQPA